MYEIAERIGLTRGAAYWHFKNKNDILLNLVEKQCNQQDEELSADGGNMRTWNDICVYFENKMKKITGNGNFNRIHTFMERWMEWPEEIREQVFSVIRNSCERERLMIEKALEKLQGEGKIRSDMSPEKISSFLTSTFRGLVITIQLEKRNIGALEEYTDFLVSAFEKELMPHGKQTGEHLFLEEKRCVGQ